MEHQEVIDWLRYCDENNIKPWEWDFKNCYSDDLNKESKIRNVLKYKNGELVTPTIFCTTKQVGSNADCDKEADFLYEMLLWNTSESNIIRGEFFFNHIYSSYCKKFKSISSI